jgi:hypothetical protein
MTRKEMLRWFRRRHVLPVNASTEQKRDCCLAKFEVLDDHWAELVKRREDSDHWPCAENCAFCEAIETGESGDCVDCELDSANICVTVHARLERAIKERDRKTFRSVVDKIIEKVAAV